MTKTRDVNDLAILNLLQDSLPLTSRPDASLSEATGLSEEEIVTRMKQLKEEGILRRVGAVLRHNRAGYTSNVLTAWTATPQGGETEEEALDRVGGTLAAQAQISHCYARKCFPGWEWPLFAMLHASSEEEMTKLLADLRAALPEEEVRVLKTVREWKKTSMRYVT